MGQVEQRGRDSNGNSGREPEKSGPKKSDDGSKDFTDLYVAPHDRCLCPFFSVSSLRRYLLS